MNIAHRGASSYAPENTFAAFDRALSLGVDHIELDVHFTSDDHIVVIHDDTVDRTTDGDGPVADHALAELQALDAGSWFDQQYAGERIPTLVDVLDRYRGRHHFHIEIKARASGLASRTIDLCKAHGVADDVTITSFWKPWLDESRSHAPEMPVGWLVPLGPGGEWHDSIIGEALESGFAQVCPRADLVTSDLVEKLHRAGFVVRCHGIFNEDLMRHAVDCGADGMTINFPDKLTQYLAIKGR